MMGALLSGLRAKRSEQRTPEAPAKAVEADPVPRITTVHREAAHQHRQISRASQRKIDAGSSSNFNYGWNTRPTSINQAVFWYGRALRARARDRQFNSNTVRRFLKLLDSNVVGHRGPRLKAKPLTPRMRMDKRLAQAVGESWDTWCRAENCDVAGELNFREHCRSVVGDAAVDGRSIIRKVYGPEAGPFGFALKAIDSELLETRYNEDFGDGRRVVMGIELDHWGRRLAYYFRSHLETDIIRHVQGHDLVRVPADQVIHSFVRERSGQIDGLTWLVTGLERVKMLDEYYRDAAAAARLGAKLVLALKTDTGVEGSVAGAEEDDDGNLLMEFSEGLEARQLEQGQSLDSVDTKYPHEQFGDFTKAILQDLASGFGVSYPVLANDGTGVNFSTLRHFELQAQEVWMALQEWLSESFCSPVYEEWLLHALLNGQIRINGQPVSVDRFEKAKRHGWLMKRWPWVDPEKEMKAQELAYALRVTSLTEIAERRGRDLSEVLDEIEEENEMLGEREIAPPQILAKLTQTPDESGGDPDQAEEGDDGSAT